MDMNEALHLARAEADMRAGGAQLVALSLGSAYAKTATGHAEVTARKFPLSRTARTLLLIMDASRPAAEWLGLVHGTTEADLDQLLAHGLIEIRGGTASGSKGKDAVADAIKALTYGELYTLLTDQAKARFGLIKGYRLVLEVEKCSGLEELQGMAQRFLAQVRAETGEAGEAALRKALGI